MNATYRVQHFVPATPKVSESWMVLDLQNHIVADCTKKHDAELICRLLNTHS